MNVEQWKDIPGFEGFYQVSDLGRVKSLDRVVLRENTTSYFREGRILKPFLRGGYQSCGLCINGISRNHLVHQLIAMTFMGHKPDGFSLVVDHINNIKTDNRLENLQIVTNRHNSTKDKKGTSKFVGVSWNSQNKKWKANIKIDGKPNYLGYFTDEAEAGLAYQNALAKLQNEKTLLNNSTRQ
jgi:hypothetical protein